MDRDEFHGQGGDYEVRDGKRVLVKGSRTESHKDGDAPRDKDGKRLDQPAADAKPEPALPDPGPLPWAGKPAAKPTAEKADTKKGA